MANSKGATRHCALLQLTLWITIFACSSILGSNAQSLHHIYPEGDCPVNETCPTLLDAFNDKEKYFNSGLVLFFHPGDHVLRHGWFHVSHISNLTLQPYENLESFIADHQAVRITCINSTIGFGNISKLHIVGIHFVSCQTQFYYTDATIQDSIFENSTSRDYGGAVVQYQGSVQFTGSTTFEGNSAEGGGAVVLYEGTMHFNDGINFIGNSAVLGGAVSVLGGTVYYSGRVAFIGNSATSEGGALFLTGSTAHFSMGASFIRNAAAAGGAVLLNHSITHFEGPSTFIANTAVKLGGALLAIRSSRVTFHGHTGFESNLAYEHGGALYVSHYSSLTFNSQSVFKANTANYLAGAVRLYGRSSVIFNSNSTFEGNAALFGGALCADFSNTAIFNGDTIFDGNTASYGGGALYLHGGNILNFQGASTFNSNVANTAGGALVTFDSNTLNFRGIARFETNTAELGGAMVVYVNSIVTFNSDTAFENNTAMNGGGLYINDSNTVSFNGDSAFKNNAAEYDGGAVAAYDADTLAFNGNSMFENNTAANGGALYIRDGNTVTFNSNSTFTNNTANIGGGLLLRDNNTLTFSSNNGFSSNSNDTVFNNCIFEDNVARKGGGVVLVHRNNTVHFNGNSKFKHNAADSVGGVLLTLESNTLIFNSYSLFEANTAQFGGVLEAGESNTVIFNDNSVFQNNSAVWGGAVHAYLDNTLIFDGTSTFEGNTARILGGALYILRSETYCYGNLSFVHNEAVDGGGIFLRGGQIYFEGVGHFFENSVHHNGHGGALVAAGGVVEFSGAYHVTGNTGGLGGAFSFIGSSLMIKPDALWRFERNVAYERGGAVYIQDSPFTNCFFEAQFNCFFELVVDNCRSETFPQSSLLRFDGNTAVESGDTIYGGALETCFTTIRTKSHEYCDVNNRGYEVLAGITNINMSLEHAVSSDPYKLCSCNNNEPECGPAKRPRHEQVYPGQVYTISVVGIGHMNGTVPTQVHAIPDNLTITSDFKVLQPSANNKECSQVDYPLLSKETNARLLLYADEPCYTHGRPVIIQITFLQCPVGFALSEQGSCICDERLQKYTDNCRIQNLSISRDQGDSFWVGVDNVSGTEELVLHPHCPFDYCTEDAVVFQLTDNGPDLQCNNKRSRVLCGACQSGHSLALGSSRCLPGCSNKYLALLLVFALAGIILVALLFVCRLSVANGTLSGLIFYANIIAVNQSIFLPSGHTNVLTVFIAWLNLDLGIETCFYEGLDTYSQTWLRFAFPIYIWVMVGVIVYLADTTTIVAKLVSKNRPVAVLSTLFLLSYTKLLQAIMAAFSFTTLDYPDGNYKLVWLYDGNIGFLDKHDGRHIALFLFSVLVFLFVFLPYTILLLCGHWILNYSDRLRLTSEVRFTPKMKLYLTAFLDPYHAPFVDKHRYWTGLLLLVRFFVLVLSSIVNIGAPQDPFVLLLVVLVTLCCLRLWVTLYAHQLYKKWYLDMLEASFIFNLIVLIGGTYHIRQSGGNQAALFYTSVSIAFVTFIGIVATPLTGKAIKWLKRKAPRRLQLHATNCSAQENSEDDPTHLPTGLRSDLDTPPCTVIELPQRNNYKGEFPATDKLPPREPLMWT